MKIRTNLITDWIKPRLQAFTSTGSFSSSFCWFLCTNIYGHIKKIEQTITLDTVKIFSENRPQTMFFFCGGSTGEFVINDQPLLWTHRKWSSKYAPRPLLFFCSFLMPFCCINLQRYTTEHNQWFICDSAEPWRRFSCSNSKSMNVNEEAEILFLWTSWSPSIF